METVCITDEANQNLTNNKKNMLQWHCKLDHVGFQRLQWIGCQGWLGKPGERFGISSVQPPKCVSCQFGKQESNPKAGSTNKVDKQSKGTLKADKLKMDNSSSVINMSAHSLEKFMDVMVHQFQHKNTVVVHCSMIILAVKLRY